ncbi:hypothetical protein Dsin_008979 [Dipteronia sinensis]|uniref:Reverse transcriptase zinc-binding domain-containing protein n=1 Tax=Dipteronia sinensis TaxID=43782 RepID=A0AAE0AQX2_9ROSI|nr:hypothetical protein Dsin_008979 [Dipteronia sinensis]
MGFWWGSKEGSKKISWVSREKVCIPKSRGGLGFKDLSAFNQALLAKQAWNGDFLEAVVKPGCSAVWRSILWSKALLLRGLRWNVGSGARISAFRDPWLPRPFSFRPVSQSLRTDLVVADFIDKQGHCWDLRRLEESFLEVDRELNLSIPISLNDRPDCLMWHFDKKGIYNVKSGYKVACESKFRAICSSSNQKGELWKLLWNLHVPPKVRVFLWKVSNNAIPYLANLFRRKVLLLPCCGRCEEEVESTSHALFWCSEVEEVWDFSEFGLLLGDLKGLGCLDILCWFSP